MTCSAAGIDERLLNHDRGSSPLLSRKQFHVNLASTEIGEQLTAGGIVSDASNRGRFDAKVRKDGEYVAAGSSSMASLDRGALIESAPNDVERDEAGPDAAHRSTL